MLKSTSITFTSRLPHLHICELFDLISPLSYSLSYISFVFTLSCCDLLPFISVIHIKTLEHHKYRWSYYFHLDANPVIHSCFFSKAENFESPSCPGTILVVVFGMTDLLKNLRILIVRDAMILHSAMMLVTIPATLELLTVLLEMEVATTVVNPGRASAMLPSYPV